MAANDFLITGNQSQVEEFVALNEEIRRSVAERKQLFERIIPDDLI